MEVIKKLTVRELEYIIDKIIFSTRRLYKYEHPEIQQALKNELAERRLLTEKTTNVLSN